MYCTVHVCCSHGCELLFVYKTAGGISFLLYKVHVRTYRHYLKHKHCNKCHMCIYRDIKLVFVSANGHYNVLKKFPQAC